MCDTESAGRGDARLGAPAAPTWLSGAEPRARLAVVAEVFGPDGVGLLGLELLRPQPGHRRGRRPVGPAAYPAPSLWVSSMTQWAGGCGVVRGSFALAPSIRGADRGRLGLGLGIRRVGASKPLADDVCVAASVAAGGGPSLVGCYALAPLLFARAPANRRLRNGRLAPTDLHEGCDAQLGQQLQAREICKRARRPLAPPLEASSGSPIFCQDRLLLPSMGLWTV